MYSAPVCEMLSKSDHPQHKKITSCLFSRWRISAILDFRGPIMDSLKSPCTTSYRSSIETLALNCLVLRKSLFAIWRQTDRQTNRWTCPSHEAALAVASGGLITAQFDSLLMNSVMNKLGNFTGIHNSVKTAEVWPRIH